MRASPLEDIGKQGGMEDNEKEKEEARNRGVDIVHYRTPESSALLSLNRVVPPH